MKAVSIVLPTCLAAALAGYHFWNSRDGLTAVAAPPTHASADEAARRRASHVGTFRASTPVENRTDHLLPDASEPIGSRNEEDAQWLSSRMYPSALEKKNATSGGMLPPDNTPRHSGDIAVAEELLIKEAYREDATETLLNGASAGSIYALTALGKFYEPTNPIVSQAYFRAAIMRGDWSITFRHKPQLDLYRDAEATMLAIRLLQDIDQQRMSRGLPPLPRDVRPGLDDAIAMMRVLAEETDTPSGGGR